MYVDGVKCSGGLNIIPVIAMNIIIIVLSSFVLMLVFVYVYVKLSYRSSLLIDWPIFRMTPDLIKNGHRLHEFMTQVLKQNHNTFQFKGPALSNLDMLCTCEPADIHYILSKNFANYPKGPEFRKIFDILGDGIFNADAYLWELHRKNTTMFINQGEFYKMVIDTTTRKVKDGLIPVLAYVSKQGIEVDLQELFQRLTFDNICSILLDHDPQSLSISLPYLPCEKAFTATEEAILYRHILPESIWKLQSLIGFGKEKGLNKARKAFDEFIYRCISMRRQQAVSGQFSTSGEDKLDSLTAHMEAYKESDGNQEKLLRDTLLNLMIAGRDTTSTALSWFFWLLSKNPSVEFKIQEEIKLNLQSNGKESLHKREELSKLVYLHGALCEALRLFPPVAFEHKAPIQADVLPSGHHVNKDSKIVLSFYSMGRMESIWGKDCLDFKPERWITNRGGIKHEPSYKFPAFNAGPRTCLGKEMAFIQMKIIAISVINNYTIKVVDGHPIVPGDSIIMHIKHGLKTTISNKSVWCLRRSVLYACY